MRFASSGMGGGRGRGAVTHENVDHNHRPLAWRPFNDGAVRYARVASAQVALTRMIFLLVAAKHDRYAAAPNKTFLIGHPRRVAGFYLFTVVGAD